MRRCCGDVTLAEDLAQQVFLQAWRKIRYLRELHSFAAWLKRLAITIWLQHLRKNDALSGAGNYDETGLAHLGEPALAMDLDRALAALSHSARLCIVLSYHEGMTHGEIAELTALPLGSVKSHIRRGTERLRLLLSAYQDAPCVEEPL